LTNVDPQVLATLIALLGMPDGGAEYRKNKHPFPLHPQPLKHRFALFSPRSRWNLPQITAHHPENLASFTHFHACTDAQTNQYPVESAFGRNIGVYRNIPVD
jgi:hypothetical protein